MPGSTAAAAQRMLIAATGKTERPTGDGARAGQATKRATGPPARKAPKNAQNCQPRNFAERTLAPWRALVIYGSSDWRQS